jgi:hypothetical protein
MQLEFTLAEKIKQATKSYKKIVQIEENIFDKLLWKYKFVS